MPLFRITYVRRDENRDKFLAHGPYSMGHFREISMVKDTEEEAMELAESRLAEQFPEDGTVHAQSNFKLQGIEQLDG